jgi:hypothetical protein
MAAWLNDSYKPFDFSARVLSNYMRVGDVWIPCRLIFDDEFVAPGSSGAGFLIKQNFGGLARRASMDLYVQPFAVTTKLVSWGAPPGLWDQSLLRASNRQVPCIASNGSAA